MNTKKYLVRALSAICVGLLTLGALIAPGSALAAPANTAVTTENSNVTIVLTPTSSPAGDDWAVGERMTFDLQLTNKTNIVRGFNVRSTNFDYVESNNQTAAGCKWTHAQPNQVYPCPGKLTHTVTEADVAAGGFQPSITYTMYSGPNYNDGAVLAGGINIPAQSTITLTNPKANGLAWRVGERMTFSVQLTNNTGIQRSFEPGDTNLSGTDGCKWRTFNNGVTANCNKFEIYHDVTEEDLQRGSFTPSLTWKMYASTGYEGATENFAPTIGQAFPVAEALKLVSVEQTEQSTQDEYHTGDDLVFTVTIANGADEALTVSPVTDGSNVTFDDDCADVRLAPQERMTCNVRYTLQNQDLAEGSIDVVAIFSGVDASDVEHDRLTARQDDYRVRGVFDSATAFKPHDVNPGAPAAISNMQVLAQSDRTNAYRIPAITVAQNGDVLVSYDARPRAGVIGAAARRAGGDSPNENSIMQRRSTDGGKTWQPATAVAAGKIGSHGYSDPSYVVDYETGKIFNFHVYSGDKGFPEATYSLDGEGNVDETSRSALNFGLSVSDDNGYTWREEVITAQVLKGKVPGAVSCFATSGAGTQKLQEPHKGRLLQQAACRVEKDGREVISAFTIYSDDHGVTWHGGEFTASEVEGLGSLRFDENKVVELSDGSLMLNSRTWTGDTGPRHRITAISRDGGVTWGNYKIRSELVDPSNNAQIIRAFPNAKPGSLRSKVLLFSNTANDSKRTNGTISMSCDDGATWPVRKQFRAGGTGYTTMVVQDDGTIGLLMEPNGGGWADIAYQNVSLSWLASQSQQCSELYTPDIADVKAETGTPIDPIALFERAVNNDPSLKDTVTVEGLPEGLRYNAQTGKVEGTPTAAIERTTPYTVRATLTEESDGTRYERSATVEFTINVSPTGGRTWYVAADGDDTNDGLSPERPFKTLNPVNRLELLPGDAVYLRRGDVFNDQFMHLNGSGSAEAPIIISAYGDTTDPLPVINTNGEGVWYQDYNGALDNSKHKAEGNVSSSILLKDVEYIEVSDLEITNIRQADQPDIIGSIDALDRTGVAVIAENIGTVNHVVLQGLYIHDVDGNVYNKHMANGGIYVIAHKPLREAATGVARFDDVRVLNNRVEDVSRWGIGVGYTGYTEHFRGGSISDSAMQQYGQTNVVVRGNYVKGAGGDSITVFYALRPLVEYNVSVDGSKHMNTTDYPAGTSFGRVAAGIWPWKTKDAVFQYNEAYNTLNAAHGNGDGMPWDSDWSDGTLYQYNYSASNTGGTYMICGVEAVNSTFRYNISQNDVGGLLDPVDRNPNGHIYNNTFYIAPDVPILKTQHNPNGRATIENNIFYYTGTTPRQENWTRGDGGGFQKLWKNNLYYNYSNTPATDTEPIKVPAGTQVFAEQDVKLAPETARVDYLTYRLPGTNEAATTRSATRAARVSRAVVDSDPFGGYRLTDTSPAADSGKTIQDENGFAPEADFFGTPLAGATDMGAVQHRSADDADSNKSIVSTIYLLTPDSRNAQNIHVPQTDNNPTPVSEVVANVKVSPLAHASVVDAEGSAVAADVPIADGMKLRITAEDGTFNDIPLVVTNEYSWVDNYVNNQQGNVWFGQRQMSADGQWFNIDTYDPTWPNWQVDRYFGPGVTGSRNLPVVGERDSIHGLLSDSPDTPGDSTAMAFRAPKTGTVTFTVKDDEPQLRQDGNTNGTVRLSLYKNGEELQSVELSQSKVTAEDWNNFTAENPITVKQGDYIRVVAHSVGAPTKPSLWISPVIEYIDVAPSVEPDPEPVAVVALEPEWNDKDGSFTVPSVEGITYSLDGDVLAPGGVVDGLAGKRVVVTAAAGEGYTLSEDSPLEFIHEFPAPSVEPDPEPDPGTDPDEPNVDPEHPGTDPDEPGVDPDQPGTDPGEPTVDPEPEPTMVKLTDPVSNVVPEAEDPASCTVKPFVDITEVEGVEYFLNDVRVEPGIVEYGYGETVVVEAKALDGYAFDKDVVTSWEWTSPTWESLKCDPTEPDPTDADSFIVGLPMLDDLQGIEGDEVSFNGVAIPEDQELPEGTRFSAEGLPEGLTIDAETGEVSGMLPEVDRTTEFEVTVTVTYPDLSADVVEYVYAVSPVDEAEPVVPPTESDDPAEDPDAPGTDPGEQGSDPADPGVDPEIPSTDPADPATDPKDPGAGSDKPGTGSQQPGTDSENPGGNPEEPTTGEPGTGGDNPATADDQPGTEPSIPTEPDVSGGDGEDRVVEPFAPHTNVLPDATDPASCTVKPFVEITGIEGVEYFLNGLRVQPGIIEYGYGETVIVEAKPREGFAFPEGAVTKWEWTAPSWESLQCAGDEPQTPLVPARDPKPSTDGLSSSTRFETLPRNSALANSGASGLAWMGAVALALSTVGLAGVARRKVQRSS